MEQELIDWHLANGTPEGRGLYVRFLELLDSIGPYTTHPAKSTITFKGSRRGFCGAHPKKGQLVGYFDLMRALEPDHRIRSIHPYTKKLFVHHFRVDSIGEMDAVFKGWLEEAYGVGNGQHLLRK